MKLKNNILIFTILLCGVVGCNPAAKFSVVEAEAPTLNGLTSLHGKATIENTGTRDLMVESAGVVVKYRDRELGTARLLLPIEVPAGRTTGIRYDFALDNFTLSSLQTLQTRIFTNPDAFTVSGVGWVRWGCLRKKIEIKGMSVIGLMGLISNFTGNGYSVSTGGISTDRE